MGRSQAALIALAAALAVCEAAPLTKEVSVDQTAAVELDMSFVRHMQAEHRSALLMASNVEKNIAAQLNVNPSDVWVTDVTESVSRRLQVGGADKLGATKQNQTRLTIRYSITCQQGAHEQNQKTCADEARNMTNTSAIASAIMAGIQISAGKYFDVHNNGKFVVKSRDTDIAKTVTQPQMVFLKVRATNCEDRANEFTKACTHRNTNSCPPNCEKAYTSFYDHCMYEPFKLFMKKRVHVWTEDDAGHKVMVGHGDASALTSETQFDVMDYVAAVSLKNHLGDCDFKETTGTCRFNYLTLILGTQWDPGTGENCSTTCNELCQRHTTNFQRSCQQGDFFETDQGNDIGYTGMHATVALESACVKWDCTVENVAHKFCDMVENKDIGAKLCAGKTNLQTLENLIDIHEGDLFPYYPLPEVAKRCLEAVAKNTTAVTIGDFCKDSPYSCAPPVCTDDNTAMIAKSIGYGGGPYNCSSLKAANFCPAGGKECCLTCGHSRK